MTAPTGPGCQAAVPDFGATASDNCGTAEVMQCPTAGTMLGGGTHTITFTATDSAGNSSHCTTTFTVVDQTPPAITCPDPKTATAGPNCDAAVPAFAATASDGCAGNITITQSPAPGTLVGLGTTTITSTATDTAGNQSSCTTTFTVIDQTPPAISCPDPKTVAAGPNCDAAVPQFPATASDGCGGNVTITQSPAAGTLVGTGVHTITLTATDAAGNQSTCTTTLTVVKTTGPSLSCPASFSAFLPLHTADTSMSVSYPAPAAVDACSTVAITAVPVSGSTFGIGTTTVNVTATDGAGNSSSCHFDVTVRYDFSGFFRPINNAPALNAANAGSTIPVKFSLSGNKGLSILASNATSAQVPCDLSGPPANPIAVSSLGGAGLNYDASSDQYGLNWKTEKSWANTCRQFSLMLKDGSIHAANFKFQ